MTKVVEQSCNILLDFEHDNPACTFWVNLNKKNSFSAEQLKKNKSGNKHDFTLQWLL